MNIPGQSFKQLCLMLLCLLASGCSGCSGGGSSKPPPPPRTEDPIAQARELYRKATDAPHFRNANERVNVYLTTNSDAIARHHPGAKDKATLQAILRKPLDDEVDKLDDAALYQKFLQTIIGLDPAEIAEVENASLKLLDAHYLEACFLFREIARSMPLQGLSPLEQAEYCFGWVNRHVVLQEGREDFLPPQYVLQRGQGNAVERAVVFLSLLQQLTPAANSAAPHIEACLIALPGKDSHTRPILAGVLIDTKGKPEVYLFDPRLGLPLPGPKGKGIATLAQLQTKPAAILDSLKLPGDALKYDVTEKEAIKKDQ
ncbi:MAG TPA: hypothetical protein VE988_15510, partial [Gemmataceae bacterium]|nr:hypothetical protein [Gemmataceae bacterium]